MKLFRFGEPGKEKPGALDSLGRMRDLSSAIDDLNRQLLGNMDKLEDFDLDSADSLQRFPVVAEGTRLGPCLADIGNVLCIGLNYAKHAQETNAPLPTEPVLFMKHTSAISGPNDPIVMPRDSSHTDWEVELGVIIGKRAKHVSVEDALDYVAGYCVVNDVSERKLQKATSQWCKGKSPDGYAPVGPWLVTADEVPDPQALRLWLKRNGEVYQDSNTSDMIFSVAALISHLSQYFTLLPGDLISTGTPSGVGMGFQPQRFLAEGDELELGVEGLGVQKQKVIRA